MLDSLIKIIREEVSERTLYQSVKDVSSFHRIQASDGYRKAAKHCVSYLQKAGLEVNHLQYPTNGKDYAGTYKLFQEYACQEAYCDMVYPFNKQLANFQLEPLSIIQRSYSCDYRKQPIDVIHMDNGCDPNNYINIDFNNKIIFIHEPFSDYHWTLEKGALGFISDFLNELPNVRTRSDLYDSLNYTSFWWKHTEDELPAFGFVLSPRNGDNLKAVIEQVNKDAKEDPSKHPYVQVCPYVNAQLFDGFIDVVEAILPGSSDETILISAHLCHPCSSANDNASGVSGAMEVMRALKELIDKGKIEPLNKTIKMILMPEFTGTYCYLCDGRDLSLYKAGINLDMIGGKQQDMYGPITITNLPHACPSYVDSFASLITTFIKNDNASFDKMKMSIVNTQNVPFQLGSDHTILSDPTLSIPTIMLGQSPDKNYHTSSDTLEVIDPIVLKFSTTLAASYVYALANYQTSYTKDLLIQMRLQFIKEMNMISYTKHVDKENNYHKLYQFFCASLNSILITDVQSTADINKELLYFKLILSMYCDIEEEKTIIDLDYQKVPKRLFHMQIADLLNVLILDKQKVEKYHIYLKAHPLMNEGHGLLQTLCDYYTDGNRNIYEISKWVISEASYGTIEDIYAYFIFMNEVELMELD